MNILATSQLMKYIDDYTIEKIGILGCVLMERAALSIASKIIEQELKTSKILAVCGIGNNGGDGMATARILYEKGYDVDIVVLGDMQKATNDAKRQADICKNIGIDFKNEFNINEYNVIIDAIFGIGLKRDVEGIFADVIDIINNSKAKVYAVDIPSGICTDTGNIKNIAIKADYTITFGFNKIGLILYPGCEYAGKVYVEDIGFSKIAIEKSYEVFEKKFYFDDNESTDIFPCRSNNSNKGTYGKILIIAGSHNMAGAAYLSAKAAYKSGAGLVKIFTPEENRNTLQTLIPEAILTTYDKDLSMEDILDKLDNQIKWANTIVIGPGIGTENIAVNIVRFTMINSKKPTIVDADAINILASNKSITLADNIILTPHMKEMMRLTGKDLNEIKDRRFEITTSMALSHNKSHSHKAIIVLKDARTVVTDGNNIYINTSGNNGLSTAGSGDVLTGIIAAFSATGLELFEAARRGVYIHGLAADNYTNQKSARSLIASDIIDSLCYL